MSNITADNLPEKLSSSDIEFLANMARKIPPSLEWRKTAKKLSSEQRVAVNNKISEINRMEIKAKEAAKSPEQKKKEAAWWKKKRENLDPNQFHGNIGEPETAQDYKNRYGVWPPNYKGDKK